MVKCCQRCWQRTGSVPQWFLSSLTESAVVLTAEFTEIFSNAKSGHGESRIRCPTHDTKKAMIQGLKAVCRYLRELQSDRLEGEFGVYHQSTGATAYMTCGDVFSVSRKRQAKYAASYLQSIESEPAQIAHESHGAKSLEDAVILESCRIWFPLHGIKHDVTIIALPLHTTHWQWPLNKGDHYLCQQIPCSSNEFMYAEISNVVT